MRAQAPFRYWGAKVRMAPWIIERLPAHDHYVEAMAGSAAVMALKPPVMAETVNDVYGEVVNFFRVMQDPSRCDELIWRVAHTPYSREEWRRAWEIQRDDLAALPVDRAWPFFVRMQMAVVPGRTGWSYSTAPASAKKANKPGRWSTMPEHLELIRARFARVQVESLDVCDLMGRYDKPGVLFLIDPPYIDDSRPLSTGKSSGYEHDDFDHEALIAAIRDLEHASVALTHYPHEFYDMRPWTSTFDFESHRNIPNGEGRDVKVERLYILERA